MEPVLTNVGNGYMMVDYFEEQLGGYPEQVRLGQALKRDDVVMLVDDEGTRKHYPMNSRASALYGAFTHGGMIVGDVVLVGLHRVMTEDGPEEEWWSIPADLTIERVNQIVRDLLPKVG
jgi:hypothetical protein